MWVNEWFNPPKEDRSRYWPDQRWRRRAVQNTDSPAVLQDRAGQGQKRAFGWDSDMTAYGPKAQLASAIINWSPYYIQASRTRWKANGPQASHSGGA
ncbi:hypothetical protein [Candidatus Aalborgicola defluviihabitans]|uniref:hypothetical protein n=1 Tax=Candidatus Aalborgicola defluviihabitans TaxID=3386187 RepID=UPI0039B86E62